MYITISQLQFACLPNPTKYLTLFNGMPSVCRLSILGNDIATKPEHSLEVIVCGDKNISTSDLLKVIYLK